MSALDFAKAPALARPLRWIMSAPVWGVLAGLWLLWREKDLPAVIVRAQQYAEESLAWLKALGYVVSVSAAAVRVETRHIGISVSVAQAGQDTADSAWVFEYDYTTARPTTVSLGTAA